MIFKIFLGKADGTTIEERRKRRLGVRSLNQQRLIEVQFYISAFNKKKTFCKYLNHTIRSNLKVLGKPRAFFLGSYYLVIRENNI